MAQVGGVFVRIRPALSAEDSLQLEQLAATARQFADELDAFRDSFAVVPPTATSFESSVVAPVRLAPVHALPEGDPAA